MVVKVRLNCDLRNMVDIGGVCGGCNVCVWGVMVCCHIERPMRPTQRYSAMSHTDWAGSNVRAPHQITTAPNEMTQCRIQIPSHTACQSAT